MGDISGATRGVAKRRREGGGRSLDPAAALVAAITAAGARILLSESLLAWMDATPRSEGRPAEPLGLNARINERHEEYWEKFTPSATLATVVAIQWSAAVEAGDRVGALIAGIVLVAAEMARAAVSQAWARAQALYDEVAWATDDLGGPIAPRPGRLAPIDLRPDLEETIDEALDRFVGEVLGHSADEIGPLEQLLRKRLDRDLKSRVERIRKCEEWKNPKGIFRGHPAEQCVVLFRKLVIYPALYEDIRKELACISAFRTDAIAFRRRLEHFEKRMQVLELEKEEAPRPLTLPGLTAHESKAFCIQLDRLCRGDVRTRHLKKEPLRAATIRVIADHFSAVLQLPVAVAKKKFGKVPWSTGFAELAAVALSTEVTSKDVRGALRNWGEDDAL